MSTVIIAPETVDFTGTKAIVQGSDNYFELQCKDVDGAIVDLTGVNQSTDIKCEFRNDFLSASGSSPTNCPQPTIYISNASQGKLMVHIHSRQSKYVSTQVLSGRYDIEIVLGGYKFRAFQGQWAVDGKQVTTKLSLN